MAFSNGKNGHGSPLAEINITPMVDVMLVLLIIFMVTAPLLNEGIDVDLPKANSNAAQSADPQNNVLTLNTQGQISISGDTKNTYSLENIEAKLTTMFQNVTDPKARVVFLRADANVPYGSVVQLMAICKAIGIEKIGMVTEPDNSKAQQN